MWAIQTDFDPKKLHPTYKGFPLKGNEMNENVIAEWISDASKKCLNLQKREVTKMLDIKNTEKWPLTVTKRVKKRDS